VTLLAPRDASSRPLFVDGLAQHGDAPALVTADGTVSHADLDERVTALADRLGPARRLVALIAGNTIDAVVGYLAALRGRHPVLLLPAGDHNAIASVCAAYDPDVVLADGRLDERRSGTAHALHPDLALLLSTSGSTGTPKLVRLSRDNLAANAGSIADYLDLASTDRAVTTLPMQYCYGLSVINSHLHAGASIVLTELSVVDACFWDLVRHTGVTSLAGVPHTFDLLDRVDFASMDVPSLRYLTQAGGRMRPDVVRRYAELGAARGWQLYIMYGQTEATARMGYLPPERAATHPDTIGIAIPGGSFTIDDPNGRGEGELVYRGPNVMLGYAERPADLGLGRTVDALRTGDLARWTAHGLVEIVGRRSRFIKPFGVRVDLDHLETHLASLDVPALCTGDDAGLVVAVARTSDVGRVTTIVDDRLHLPPSRVRVVQLDEVPRLGNGKPDHLAVRDLARAQLDRQPCSLDAGILAAFNELLHVEASPDDSFVSLGGDSLSYVEVSVRLEALLGTLPRDWHTRPIRDLTPGRERHRLAGVETSVVVRALATVLIVGTHAGLWHHPGGAHALLVVAGYNFARFQLAGAKRWTPIARVALPSMVWMAVLAATTDGFAWPHALLVNGLLGTPDARWAYWFIEALVYILTAVTALLSVPAIARLERRQPFLVPAVAVVFGFVTRFDLIDLTADHRTTRPHEVFWLFALGWAAARATDAPRRVLVTALAVAAIPGFFADSHRELIVLATVVLVTWMPTIPLPRRLVAPLGAVAGASLFIYLTQFQVYPPVHRALGPVAAVAASLAVGIVTWLGVRRVTALAHRRVTAAAAARRGPRQGTEALRSHVVGGP